MRQPDKWLYDKVRLEAFGHPIYTKTSRYWHPCASQERSVRSHQLRTTTAPT